MTVIARVEPGDGALKHEVVRGRPCYAEVDERDGDVDDSFDRILDRREAVELAPELTEGVREQRVEQGLLGREVVRQRLLANADRPGNLADTQRGNPGQGHLGPRRIEDLSLRPRPADILPRSHRLCH